MPIDKALLIFIKNPEPGKVKTRLARAVGDQQALAIYRVLLEYTREVTQAVDAHRMLFYSTFIDPGDNWPETDFEKLLQQGRDLGARMDHAFQLAFQRFTKAVLIGSDCASLTPEIIFEAFSALDRFPYVLGPALDGGYYLLGMRAPAPFLFKNMTWSTANVLTETIQRIGERGQSHFLLPALSDIDTVEDWEKYGWDG